MLARELTNEEYLVEKNLPNLDGFGFRFIVDSHPSSQDDFFYQHKEDGDLLITVETLGQDCWNLCPAYTAQAKTGDYWVGHVYVEWPKIFYPEDIKQDLHRLMEIAVTPDQSLQDYQIPVPEELESVRSMTFETPSEAEIHLRISKNYSRAGQEDTWAVALLYERKGIRFLWRKSMVRMELNGKGIRYWFRQIKKWYLDPENPVVKVTRTILEATKDRPVTDDLDYLLKLREKIETKTLGDICTWNQFFDSFRKDYPEFDQWAKAHQHRPAFVYSNDTDKMLEQGVLVFKHEVSPDGIIPRLPGSWTKICCLKADPEHRKIGTALMLALLASYPDDRFYITSKSEEPCFLGWLEKHRFRYHGTYKDEKVYVRYRHIQ